MTWSPKSSSYRGVVSNCLSDCSSCWRVSCITQQNSKVWRNHKYAVHFCDIIKCPLAYALVSSWHCNTIRRLITSRETVAVRAPGKMSDCKRAKRELWYLSPSVNPSRDRSSVSMLCRVGNVNLGQLTTILEACICCHPVWILREAGVVSQI